MGCLLAIFVAAALFGVIYAFSISPILGIVISVGIIWGAVYFERKEQEKKQEIVNTRQSNLDNSERGLEGFTCSQKFVSQDMDTSIMID
ncbi:MAG: hypothetical protein ACQEXX_06175 [Bacillota bacterium]